MKRDGRYIFVFFLVVLTVTLAGCGGGVPQEEYDNLQNDFAQAQQDCNTAKSHLLAVQKDLDTATTQLDSVQGEYNSVQAQLEAAKDEIAVLQNDKDTQADVIAEKQAEITQLENRLDSILNTTLTQYYRLSFQARTYEWDLPVSLQSYFYFKDKPRPYNLPGMVLADDPILDTLVNAIKNSSLINDLKKSDVVSLIARLVQSLPRTNKDVRTPFDDYPRYPVETLVDQAADSEDGALLAAALLYRLEYDVVLFYHEEPEHLAVGVYMPGVGGYYWENAGKRYYYLETTGEVWELGDCPPPYRTTQIIYTIGE